MIVSSPAYPRPRRRALLILGALLVTGALLASHQPALAADTPAADDPLATVATRLQQASRLGARGDLPGSYRTLEKKLDDARRNGASAQQIVDMELDGRRLVNQAAFVQQVRDSRSPLETMTLRFDSALREIASVEGVDLDSGLAGSEAADRLLELLTRQSRARQVLIDSLRVEVGKLSERAYGHGAANDSLITSLQVENSDLRRRLWETELRAGVAEADRSAAESALTRRQQREAAVKDIRKDLGDQAGDVLMTPDGAIILQVHGLDFGVGSSQLRSGQEALVGKLVDAIKRFPDTSIRVEGHTDDTGNRAANLALSEKRAATVASLLAKKLGVAPDTIPTKGYGPDRPVAPNSTPEGRARNRRIDVVITPQE